MRAFLMRCFCAGLRVCYFFIRLFTRPRHKVVFLSRQADQPSLDFRMLAEELGRADPAVEVVMLCRAIGSGLKNKIGYGFHLFTQMGHLATARAAVLDGYCMAASVPRHRKSLKIYQLWHALGLLKNFGYAAVGTPEGSDPVTARIMRMHRGYHRIQCSSPALIPGLAGCYDAPESAFLPLGLPRVDFLTDPDAMDACKRELFAVYPALADGKPAVLYAPTFRKEEAAPPRPLDEALDLHRFHLVIKAHDGSETVITDGGVFHEASGKSGMEWIAAADVVVTDYSAISFEALAADKPLVLYCPDRDEYTRARGFAASYDAIPAPRCATPREVADAIDRGPRDPAAADAFCARFLSCRALRVTPALAAVILQGMAGNDLSYGQILQMPEFLKKE